MILGQHYQNAYVTRNIEKAIEKFKGVADVGNVMSFEVPVELNTPTGSGTAISKLAFIWVDNLQYELIEPVSGLVDIYRDALPEDDSLQFHHICMRVEDWDAFRGQVGDMHFPLVLEGGSDTLKFLYLDARKFLGHYLEYVWMTPEMWTQIGGS